MKLKKSFTAMCGIALLAGTIVSCSSNDDFTSQLEIENKLTSTGITSEIDGLCTSIKIKSNDSWTIEVPEEAQRWLDVPVDSGRGDMEIPISIDPNFSSTVGRKTTITIKTGSQEQKIDVSQTPTYQGQSVATNGQEGLDQAMLLATKGVGTGYASFLLDSTTQDVTAPKKQPILNLNVLKALQDEDKLQYGTLILYNSEAAARADGAVVDSLESKKDSLGASLTFSLNYARFQIKLGGSFHGIESKRYYKNSYNYGASFKASDAIIDAQSAKAIYAEACEEKAPKSDHRTQVLTAGFKGVMKDIDEAVKSGDSAEINTAIKALVDKYGTLVITGCKLGGRIAMSMKFNRDSIADTIRIDTARIEAGYKSFLSAEHGGCETHGGGEVSYQKLGTTILENSAYKFEIAGGSKAAQDKVNASLTLTRQEGDKKDVYGNVQDNIAKWVESISADDASTLTAMSYTTYPIWSLFSYKTAAKIKDYIYKHYSSQDPLGLLKNNSVINAVIYDKPGK